MIFHSSKPQHGQLFLQGIEQLIEPSEFSRFSQEFGFVDPNNFPFKNIQDILFNHQFPECDHFEYGWAIYECGFDRLATYSKAIRLFSASIYLYCHKVSNFGGNFESGFYYLLINKDINNYSLRCGELLSIFLEWLYEHVKSDRPNDDYYLLLTWALNAMYLKKAYGETFLAVISRLTELRYSAIDIQLNNDCWFPQQEDWLNIIDKLPPPKEFDIELFVPIVCGWDN
jgi:hypothetical protein